MPRKILWNKLLNSTNIAFCIHNGIRYFVTTGVYHQTFYGCV